MHETPGAFLVAVVVLLNDEPFGKPPRSDPSRRCPGFVGRRRGRVKSRRGDIGQVSKNACEARLHDLV